MDAQADLDLRFSHMDNDPFDMLQMKLNLILLCKIISKKFCYFKEVRVWLDF